MTLGPALAAAPAIDGDGLFVTLADGRLMHLALSTGDVRWTVWLDADSGDLLAANDRVYVGERDGGFVAYWQKNGEYNWRKQFNGETVGAATSDLEHVYVSLLDNTVRALDRHTGNQSWTTPLETRPAAGPAVLAGAVLIASSTGEIMVSRGKDGRGTGKIAAPKEDTPGVTPHLIAFTVAGPSIVRLVANGDGTLSLTAYRRAAAKPKGSETN